MIVAIDGAAVPDIDGLQRRLAADAIGREIAIDFVRSDRRLTLAVVPGEASRDPKGR